MKKNLYNQKEVKEISCDSSVLDKLTLKSSNIKAKLKFKYLISKLERSCSFNKFI